jgi:hypothetical protein
MFRLASLLLVTLLIAGLFGPPSFAQQSQQQIRETEDARRRAETRKRIDDEQSRSELRRKERSERRQGPAVAAPVADPAAASPVQKRRTRAANSRHLVRNHIENRHGPDEGGHRASSEIADAASIASATGPP